MNSDSVFEELQNFEHNIKNEPEAEFLCVLPSYDSGIAYEEIFNYVKQENGTQSDKFPRLQCKICQKIVGSKVSLNQHTTTHQKQQCKVCNRKFLSHSFEKHMESHKNENSERKFECKICFYKLLTKSQLSCHVLSHSSRFQCDLCGYSSAYKRNVMVHMTLHLVQGQYKCLFCRKLFDDRESFRFHSRQAHRDSKNRKELTKSDLFCGTCGREFDYVPNRIQHEKTHEEKVQCKICDNKYKISYMSQHLRIHKIKKKGIKYICDICGFENAFKNVIKPHLEVHLNPELAECKICPKTYANTKSLKIHLKRVHNLNVKPSELYCNICHVKFLNSVAMKRHKNTHMTPEKCLFCSKLIKPQSLRTHLKLHELKK